MTQVGNSQSINRITNSIINKIKAPSIVSGNNNLKINLKNNNVLVSSNKSPLLTGRRMVVILFIVYLMIMIGYFVSSTYRVGNVYSDLHKYKNYLIIDSTYLNNKKDKQLREFNIATAFRPYLAKNQLLDYVSDRLLQKTLMSGARCIYIDIFNSSLSANSYPVISSGYERGNWKLTLNTMTFDRLCQVISETAFTSGYVNNYNDPLILLLNLKTNRNYICINKIQTILYKYFKNRLLGPKYSYQKTDMGSVKIGNLMGKVLLFSSGGYENTSLEELINFSWSDDKLKKILYKSLESESAKYASEEGIIKIGINDVRVYNNTNMTLIVPDEGSFFTYNYNTENFFLTGCNMIAMNYQKVGKHMDEYITKFRESSFILKKI